MSELKPCPFCGDGVEMVNTKTYPNGERSPAYIKCKTCNYHIADYEDEILIHQWNTRPIEDELRAEIARRDEEVAELRKQKYIPVHDTLTDAGKEYYEKCIRQEKELARRDEIIARLKEDACRLLEYGQHIPTGNGTCRVNAANGSLCVCGFHDDIELHRALMKELE